MKVGNEKIREYILKKGFCCIDYKATNYVLKVEAPNGIDEIEFGCILNENKMIAKFPDYVFNRKNPFSTKDTIINFRWDANDDDDTIIYNIEKFFDKVITLNEV